MRTVFNGHLLPNSCSLVGYTWLVSHFDLILPVRQLSCIGQKRLDSARDVKGEWTIFDSQIQFQDSIGGHFEFALKHEKVDLLLLKRLLENWDKSEVENYISKNLKGIYRRKIWFYYELFLDQKLELEDIPPGKYENLINEKEYFTSSSVKKSKRHKINNNLLGTKSFCPMVRKSEKLKQYINKDLERRSRSLIGNISPAILRRASSFLLLSDSKASFEIEGERPPRNRIERWGKIINEAGKITLSIDEIERLHAALISDSKMLKVGLRKEGVFSGERDRDGTPLPEFIGARPDDLRELLNGWLEVNQMLSEDRIDPILHSAIIAFSFVYIHPLEDGNGRIHRYLFHHILGKQKFYSSGMIFPISNVILDEIEKYRNVLINHSAPLMDCIEWQVTEKQNVEVRNDTSDLYRFFDCTEACEFIYECAEKMIGELLPKEITYLESFDKSFGEAKEVVEMADHLLKQLLIFIIHNDGKLSARKKNKFFENLTDILQEEIEAIVKRNFQ